MYICHMPFGIVELVMPPSKDYENLLALWGNTKPKVNALVGKISSGMDRRAQ